MIKRWAFSASLAMLVGLGGILIGASLRVKTASPLKLFETLTAAGPAPETLVLEWRLQRVVGAFLVGACLALAGVIYQGAFRNPLAEPFLLGRSAGGALGAALAILLPLIWLSGAGLPVLAFIGA